MKSLIFFQPISRCWNWLFGKILGLLERPRPVVFTGTTAIEQLVEISSDLSVKRLLIMTDEILVSLGLVQPIITQLEKRGVAVTLFTGVQPDPTFESVDRALEAGKKGACDSVLAIGGGSAIDSAKVVALALTNCDGTAAALVGQFKAKKGAATLLAIPTTAGTGAEVTMAAVITDSSTSSKKLVVDNKLIPLVVALQPEITASAPLKLTAIAGLDALSHAIEGYVSLWATKETDRLAEMAVSMIFRHLPIVCKQPDNLASRECLLVAAHMGGLVINRAAAGYVHAISHQIGGIYKLPHGAINAGLIVDILNFSRPKVEGRIAQLAIRAGLAQEGQQSNSELFDTFIKGFIQLREQVGLVDQLDCVSEDDIPKIVEGAMFEANTTYGVPKYMNHAAMTHLLQKYVK